jgi:hypothetical protein
MEDVMAQCHTPQQKATLILRQAGQDLTHEWYSYPEFQAFVGELRRVANTPKESKPEPIPNDVYKDVITLIRELARGPEKLENGNLNGEKIVSQGMGNFVNEVVKAGVVETSAHRAR